MADLGRRLVESHWFHFFVVSMLCFCSVVSSVGRKINITEVGCSQDTRCLGKNYSIVHVIAESDDRNNAIHYLWSAFVSPTIIVAYFQGRRNIVLHVNWTEVLNHNLTNVKAIAFSEASDYTVAFVAPAIYEFSDPDDKLYYNEEKHSDVIRHPFEKVNWQKPDIDHENNSTTFRGSVLGGTVTFQCNASFDDGRETELPHELYTSNSSVFTFTLGNLANLTSQNTRLIFELLSLNTDGSKTCLLAERSLDDEHTPAVFKTIVVNNSGDSGQSYFAWKPVAYTQHDRNLDCQVPSYMYLNNKHVFISEDCHYPPPKTLHHDHFYSIAQLLEGIALSSGMNVSFGQQKDGWYQKTKYLSWSGTVGYGTPASESFSAVVWIIIFVGFGAPMLAIIIAVVYIIVKKLRRRRLSSSYGQIN